MFKYSLLLDGLPQQFTKRSFLFIGWEEVNLQEILKSAIKIREWLLTLHGH